MKTYTLREFSQTAARIALAGAIATMSAHAATLVDIATDATDPLHLEDSEPSIAVNPVDPQQIAVVSFSENWGPNAMAPVWKSNDGGVTWRKVFQIPQPQPGLSGPGDQKIAFNSAGLLFIAELGSPPRRNFVFRQTGAADAPLTVGAAYGDDQPHLDVDRAAGPCPNRLYSPWLNFGVANPRSSVSNSATGGALMANVGAGNNGAFPNRTTRIAIAPDGRAYIVYKTREGTVGAEPNQVENAHFRVNRSDDCGATWNALGGAAGVSIHGAAAVQTFFTNQFGNPAKGKVARARSSDAWIAADPGDGDLYVAHVRRDASGFGQIYVARSTDQGNTWVSTRVTDGTHHSAFPEIAVAANGTVGVLYIDFDDAGTSTIFRHRFARSFDDGANWSDQILQSMDPTPFFNARSGFIWGDYEGLTAMGNTFFGVFTGQSIGRGRVQLDPIFFKETAEQPSAAPSFEYAAKIVCGVQKDPKDMRLARGFYATTINIHNPNPHTVKFFKKLALSYPPKEQRPGKIFPIAKDALRDDEALKVDCNDIRQRLFPNGFPTPYIEGFVVIQSPASLDVTAVYSTAVLDARGNVTDHSSIDVEQVREREKKPQQRSDLIPVPDAAGQFCRLAPGPDQRLLVTVKNQGAGAAGASTTEVDFFSLGRVSLPTGALDAGDSTELSFPIPSGCFSPDCQFKITVDAADQVPETDEGNNVATGLCLG